ncbi:cyclin d2 [Trifolium pratense]|uniref:Cyclin d2 n=1 Tax=Trifolium pratense TaxID=57577 RepID=A0A2K3PF22_TRIPR|nr:cyclin d2 [Trifolium pratense]
MMLNMVAMLIRWRRCTRIRGILGSTIRGTNNNDFGVVPDELSLQSEECMVLMLEKEFQQWSGADYLNMLQYGVLDVGARNEAIDWIQKKRRAWTMQLLAVACISLAAKVEETGVPMILGLQVKIRNLLILMLSVC